MSKKNQDQLRKIVTERWPISGVYYGGKPYYAVSVERCEFQVWDTPEGYAVLVREGAAREYVWTLEEIPDAMVRVGQRARPELAARLERVNARPAAEFARHHQAQAALSETLRCLDEALSIMAPA